MTLSIGSSISVILSGGPQQINYDSCCYQIEIYDPDIIKVIPAHWNATSKYSTYNTTHNLEVTCLSKGVSTFLVAVGRVGGRKLKQTTLSSFIEITVECSLVASLGLTLDKSVDCNIIREPSTGLLMWNYQENLPLKLSIKDKDGSSILASNALRMEFILSDDSLNHTNSDLSSKFGGKNIHRHMYKIVQPKQKKGRLDISVKFVGYDQDILDTYNIVINPAIVPYIDDYYEYEDKDNSDISTYEYLLHDDISVILVPPRVILEMKNENGNNLENIDFV